MFDLELTRIDVTRAYDEKIAADREIYALKRIAAIEAFDTTGPIRSYMLANARQRGSMAPEAVDYTKSLQGAVNSTRTPFGKAREPYKPLPGAAGIKLQPAKAVRVSSTQESYSDDSVIAIPYTVDPSKPMDAAVFQRNLSELMQRAQSHNGMAGSGCTYSVTVAESFVLVHCRASIAD